ncbi:MAG: hypothetical protein CVU69_00810 [Deltaproteobacteria bacterium HGW-Deltaproteobacteria-4]|nr:MAG: hypothetical protein CVU69_00810 [Deltaproteobacteria bacterium HGW-Deltaproteobacteria-4]
MKRSGLYFFAVLLVFLMTVSKTAFAGWDTYIGDAAIYSAIDTGSNRPKPHVLFLIDTSKATVESKAIGVKYDPDTPYDGAYLKWAVYPASQQGTFATNKSEIVNTTSALELISCTSIKNVLLASGTYSGSGTTAEPNLSGGACAYANKGASYALGNYLNYLSSSSEGSAAAAGTNVVKKVYTCSVTRKTGSPKTVTVTNGCVGTFLFSGTTTHTSDASTEPLVGVNWQTVWTQTSGGCLASASPTYCSATSSPVATTVDAAIPAWTTGVTYIPSGTTAFAGGTPRELIYNALANVVDGARFAVKFGAMTYNPNNQGGKVIYGMDDLSDNTKFNNFKLALPRMSLPPATPVPIGADYINAGPQRPQAEALFDAGYYMGAKYPTSGTIAANAVFPLPNATFTRQSIGSTMANTYLDSNKNPCQYNHIILITIGLPNAEATNGPYKNLVDSDGDGRADETVYGAGTHYMDDVAAFLYKQENIVTHTVLAFQMSDPLTARTAEVGGGQFYNVYNANTLAKALTELLANIVLEADTSFVAPVVPASSTNRTISSNRVYLGLFKPQSNKPWLGNLKKYGVSSNLELLDRAGNPATNADGDFILSTKSYWGSDPNNSDKIMSFDGLLPLTDGGVSGDGGNVSAGGAGGSLKVKLISGGTRNIYTRPIGSTSTALTNSQNAFSLGNSLITDDDSSLDLDTAAERDKLIKYVSGYDGYDENQDGNTNEIRDWPFGDILHSKPLVVNYSRFTTDQESDCAVNKSMIYVGANDGMLHAIKDCNGEEAWSYIPETLLPKLKNLKTAQHNYYVDESATAYMHDVNGDGIIEGSDKVVLIFGLRQGGGKDTLDASGSRGAYYALDVTDPLSPVWLWRIDNTTAGFGEIGETWGQPRITKMKIGTGDYSEKVVAFFGAGYDNNEDLRYGNNNLFPNTTTVTTSTSAANSNSGFVSSLGTANQLNPKGRGLYAVEVATLVKDVSGQYQPSFTNSGVKIWGYDASMNAAMKYSFPSELTILDTDGNGFSDRIYVGDTGGQMWRFNIGSTIKDEWTAKRIFSANGPSDPDGVGRKLFYKPAVAVVKGVISLYFGTGDRSHPLNRAVVDRLFMVRDRNQETDSNISIGNLINMTSNTLQDSNATAAEISTILTSLDSTTNYGWYVNLENTGEKVLAAPLVFNKQVFYTTYTSSPDNTLDICQIGNLGTSRLYQIDYATAEAVYNHDTTNDATLGANERAKGDEGKVLRKSDRVKNIGIGIPSGIVTLIDASGKVSLMISSSNRVGSYKAPDAKMITPLYWIKY